MSAIALPRHAGMRQRRGVNPALADPWLLGIALCLAAAGLVMVASASVSIAERDTGTPFHYLQRQMVFALAGFAGAWFATVVPLQVWERLGRLLMGLAFLLLISVLVPGIGHEVNGAQRWISLGLFNVQVAEPARLLLLVYLAGYLVRYSEAVQSQFSGFARPMLVLALASVLMLLQPDFGAAVVLLAAAFAMILLGGVLLRHYAALGVIATLGMMSMVWISPYRLQRLFGFRDPWADPYNSGFQLTQSLIAIGRGEWFGVGLGGSVQKLFYLPEAHTDFMFAVIAEEFGLAGSLTVIALFLGLVWRALRISRDNLLGGNAFAAYLACGLGAWLGIQAFINIGVNMGVLPTKGLTLPLMSYGGSSLLVSCVAVGLLLRAAHEARMRLPVGGAR